MFEHWTKMGDVELAMASDGVFKMDGGALFGLTPKTMWGKVMPPDEENRLPLAMNCLLIRSDGKTILVETGLGSKLTPHAAEVYGREPGPGLVEDMARHGVSPGDIDFVVNSHLHTDHCGGDTRLDGDRAVPTFPRARYVLQAKEWQAATHPNERTRGTYLSENVAPLDECDQLMLIEGQTPLTRHVTCMPTPGHSPGHQSVFIRTGAGLVVFLGDIGQFPIHMERVAWIAAFDIEPLVTLEVKKSLLRTAVEEEALLILTHWRYPGTGRLKVVEGRNRWSDE